MMTYDAFDLFLKGVVILGIGAVGFALLTLLAMLAVTAFMGRSRRGRH